MTRRIASPITRLRRRVNSHELAAADHIIAAHDLSSGSRSGGDLLGFRGGCDPGAADRLAAHRADTLRRFNRWRADLRGTPALAAAEAVLFHEVPLRTTERANHWRNGTCMRHLVIALRHYAALVGNTPRGASDWRFCGQSN